MALKTYRKDQIHVLASNLAADLKYNDECTEYTLKESYPKTFSYPMSVDSKAVPVVARVFPYEQGSTKNHTVCLVAFKKDSEVLFFFTCGSGFLTASIDKHESVSLVNKVYSKVEHRQAALTFYGILPVDAPCGFWQSINREPAKAGCKHVRKALRDLQNSGTIKGTLDALESAINEPPTAFLETPSVPETPFVEIKAGSFDPSDPLVKAFEYYLGPDIEHKTPMLVLGDQGSSKTYTARAYGRNRGFDKYVEAGCHSGMEAFDFIGGQVRVASGELVWMDGPIAEAFRNASNGKKTFLMVDEIYRAPRRERSVFLTALSPHDGKYRLVTGRPVNIREEHGTSLKVAEQEIIEAPVSNISIVSTTNVGADFDIEEDDPAMKERWIMFYRFTDASRLKSILTQVAKGKAYSMEIVDSLINFYNNMKKIKEDNAGSSSGSTFVPSVRVLSRAILLSKSESDVKKLLNEFAVSWVDTDVNGKPIDAQIRTVYKAISMAFKT